MSVPRRYFDNAATSFPKPPRVAEAMLRYMQECGGSGRGAYAESLEAGRLIRQCRERIARLVGLNSPEHVIFGYNTSDGLNLGLKGTLMAAREKRGLRAKMHVVLTALEHNSILRPLAAMRRMDPLLDATVVDVDPATGLLDPDDVRRAIRPGETVIACINHASNVTGTVQDLHAIGRVCAEFGAGVAREHDDGLVLLVDGAQSLGHVEVDMRAMHIDLLAFPGHKGLLGPTGTGGLCIRPGVEHRVATIREGGTGNISEQQTHPSMMPEKYEAGSHNTVGIIGLSEGVAWLLETGIAAVREHELRLMKRFLAEIAPGTDGVCRMAPGLRLLGISDASRLEQRLGTFSVVHDELSPQEMAMVLESSFGILTRAGLHCAPLAHELMGTGVRAEDGQARGFGATRLSFGPFLLEADVDHAAAALAEMSRTHAVA